MTTGSEPGKTSSPCKPSLCHRQLLHKSSREGHFPTDAVTPRPVGGPHEQITGTLMDKRIPCHSLTATCYLTVSAPFPLGPSWDLESELGKDLPCKESFGMGAWTATLALQLLRSPRVADVTGRRFGHLCPAHPEEISEIPKSPMSCSPVLLDHGLGK